MKKFIILSIILLTGCMNHFQKDCVKEGMTTDEVRNKCGNPESILSPSDEKLNWKVYVYGGYLFRASFICFRNDKVTEYRYEAIVESSWQCQK